MSLPRSPAARSLFIPLLQPRSFLSKLTLSCNPSALRHRGLHLHSLSRRGYISNTPVGLSRPRSHFYSTVHITNKPRTRGRRILSFVLIATTTFSLSFYLALTYTPPYLGNPDLLARIDPKMGSHIPTDAETLTLYSPPDEFSTQVNDHITQHELARELRADPTWKESRPHLRIPEAVKHHNLTAGTLSSPGGLTVPPLYFNKLDGSEMVQIFYVGDSVSGHPGIVHGGFLAVMMDEGLARCAFQAMQNKVGVTANLNINYRKPVMAGQFLVLRAKTTKVEGRKAWSAGWIEPLEDAQDETMEVNGQEIRQKPRLVEAEALFIEPKHSKVRTTGELTDEILATLGLASTRPTDPTVETQLSGKGVTETEKLE